MSPNLTPYELLDAYLLAHETLPIPYVLAEDIYAIERGLGFWRKGKTRDADNGALIVPVMSVPILDYHPQKGRMKGGIEEGAAMDLCVAVASRLVMYLPKKITLPEVSSLVAEELAKFSVRALIVHRPENLGIHHEGEIADNPDYLINAVIEQAKLWGCKLIISGGWKLWWALSVSNDPPAMELFVPARATFLEAEFVEEMKQQAIKGAYGYDAGDGISLETAHAIWDAVDCNRALALTLLETLINQGAGAGENQVTTERVRQLTHGLRI